MAHTHLTIRKSTGRQPTGQLAHQNVPPPQEPRPDSPPYTSQEEEPFKIVLVVQGSQTAQGTPAEGQQQQEDNNIDTEDEDGK
jgi:hypothetical protein